MDRMKIRIAAFATFPILFAFAALAIAPGARAQSLQPPPVTSGLWQSEATMTMEGMPNMPSRGPITTVTQSCMTPDTWKNFGHPERMHAECTATNVHQDAHRYSLEEVCKGNRSSTTDLQLNVLIDSAQRIHGTVQMTMTIPNLPHPMVTNTKFESHLVSSSCGSMKPGDVKTLHENQN